MCCYYDENLTHRLRWSADERGLGIGFKVGLYIGKPQPGTRQMRTPIYGNTPRIGWQPEIGCRSLQDGYHLYLYLPVLGDPNYKGEWIIPVIYRVRDVYAAGYGSVVTIKAQVQVSTYWIDPWLVTKHPLNLKRTALWLSRADKVMASIQ